MWLKILLIVVFGFITWQDCKERNVYWFLYPLVGLLGFFIQQEYNTGVKIIFLNTLINLSLVLVVLIVLWIYSKIILKQEMVNKGIGVGDLLFFIFLSFCFSIISFYVLFIFSLLFSLFLHLLFKRKETLDLTIPLAGYMSIFFAVVYLFSFFVNCNFIFAY